MTGDDPRNSFGSADSVKNYDYCRTRNRREISDAAGKKESGGFVLRRLKAFESSNSELGGNRQYYTRASYDPGHSLKSILFRRKFEERLPSY